jgi:hypothetical protein
MPDPDESWDDYRRHNNCAVHAVLTMLKLRKHPQAPPVPCSFAQLQQLQQFWLRHGLLQDDGKWPAMSHDHRSKILKFYGMQLLPVYKDLWTDAADYAEDRQTPERFTATLKRLCADERLFTTTTCGIVRVEPRCCKLCADPVTCSHRHAFSFESGGTVETLKLHDQSVSVFVQTPSGQTFWRKYADYVVTGVHEAVYDSGHGDGAAAGVEDAAGAGGAAGGFPAGGAPAGRRRVKQVANRIVTTEVANRLVTRAQHRTAVAPAFVASAAGSRKRKGQS